MVHRKYTWLEVIHLLMDFSTGLEISLISELLDGRLSIPNEGSAEVFLRLDGGLIGRMHVPGLPEPCDEH